MGGLYSRSFFCLGHWANESQEIQPLTFFIGKSATAVSIAKYYNAACLNIDSIVLEAISDSNNIPGIRARELCIKAAIEQSMKEGEESGKSHFLWLFVVKRPAPPLVTPIFFVSLTELFHHSPVGGWLTTCCQLTSPEENSLHQASTALLAAQCRHALGTAGNRTMNKTWPIPLGEQTGALSEQRKIML